MSLPLWNDARPGMLPGINQQGKNNVNVQTLTLESLAYTLENSRIIASTNHGAEIVHSIETSDGTRAIVIASASGNSFLVTP